MPAIASSQSRGGAEAPPESVSAARLALAEMLLCGDDAAECARATVDWLAERGGARKAICALIDAESGSLRHVRASGVSEGQLDSLHLALEQADHPLLFALAGRDPVTLGRNGRRNGDPWRDFLAIPLPMSEKREARQGLLLVSPGRCGQEAKWAAERRELLLVSPSEGSDLLFELLSSVVQHPREGTCVVSILRNVTDLRAATEQIEENYRGLKLAESDVRAERDRLDLIIDSVADPILVTDSSGKILLMNSPAERLFTAPAADETTEAERAVRSNDAHFSSFVSNLFLT